MEDNEPSVDKEQNVPGQSVFLRQRRVEQVESLSLFLFGKCLTSGRLREP